MYGINRWRYVSIIALLSLTIMACYPPWLFPNMTNAPPPPPPPDAINPITPTDVAKVWFEALMMGDVATLREFTCAEQSARFTNTMFDDFGMGLAGIVFDFTDITYTFMETEQTVALDGILRGTFDDIAIDIPMELLPLFPLKMHLEAGGWRVCFDFTTLTD